MILETERLIIREYMPDDFDALAEIICDPYTMRYYARPYDREGVDRWIRWCLDSYKSHGFGLWALESKETGEFIGDCGISLQHIDGQILPEIGYHVNKKYWHRGYAKEACAAVKDWFFTHTDYAAVYSYMNAENFPSAATAASNGMTKVKSYTSDGEDLLVYSISRAEWLIGRAEKYVREKLEGDFGGHDYFHTLRVYKMACRLAALEGADTTIVSLAALLHDVDDRKLSPETHDSLQNARDFMTGSGVATEAAERVCEVIRQISFGENRDAPTTLEGMCVQDADRLDAIGAIGIGRAFAYGGSKKRHMHHPDVKPSLNMTKEEYRNSESTTVNHFYEKLFKLTAMMNTASAKEIASAREGYMTEFLSRFLSEWDGLM